MESWKEHDRDESVGTGPEAKLGSSPWRPHWGLFMKPFGLSAFGLSRWAQRALVCSARAQSSAPHLWLRPECWDYRVGGNLEKEPALNSLAPCLLVLFTPLFRGSHLAPYLLFSHYITFQWQETKQLNTPFFVHWCFSAAELEGFIQSLESYSLKLTSQTLTIPSAWPTDSMGQRRWSSVR